MIDEDAWLCRHGLRPAAVQDVRSLLETHTRLERRAQGEGDTVLMKLCCTQLFNVGELDDVLLIWDAKTASFDADCSIDVQLLCGRGLAETKAYLSGHAAPAAPAALARLIRGEDGGDFAGFTPAARSAWYDAYYADQPDGD